MMWLHDGEKFLKICLLVSTESTKVTNGRTDRRKHTRGKNQSWSYAAVNLAQFLPRSVMLERDLAIDGVSVCQSLAGNASKLMIVGSCATSPAGRPRTLVFETNFHSLGHRDS